MEKANLTRIFFKVYNGGQYAMVLIKNVITTSKGDKYLNAQHYIIFTKVVDVTIQTCHHDRPIYLNMLTNKDL
jgi:hypothetical protein